MRFLFDSRNCKQLVFAVALGMLCSVANAQRPSLGGLQTQIDGLLTGEVDFSEVRFGENCTIGIDPELSGLTESDPNGFRLLGMDGQGCTLLFGPTDLCTIGIDPLREGMIFRDIGCFIFENPLPAEQAEVQIPGGFVRFGDDCTIGIDPNFTGMVERDPNGFRLLGQNGQGCTLLFGPSDLCTIGVDPSGPEGMIFRDVGCFIFENPLGEQPEVQVSGGFLRFGDQCTLGVDPNFSGMVERDPGGLRLLGQDGIGCILTFGPTDECRILVDPKQPNFGMTLSDPRPVLFNNPNEPGGAQVVVDGTIFANEFAQNSQRKLKENIRTIDDPIETVKKLRGVYFDWKDGVNDSSDGHGSADLGFIAEEVAEVLNEAAVYDDTDQSPRGVKYANLVALVVESVKAQQEQIESQQELIEELKQELESLQQDD